MTVNTGISVAALCYLSRPAIRRLLTGDNESKVQAREQECAGNANHRDQQMGLA
jgi:hypothetical protein